MGSGLNSGTASKNSVALCCVRLNTWVAPGPHMAFILGLCRPFSKSFLGNRQQDAES